MESLLLRAVYQDEPDLPTQISELLASGEDPNFITKYKETPLRVASNNGRFDAVRLLLESGANQDQLGWNDLCRAVALVSLTEVTSLLDAGSDLGHRDYWNRTPFLIAIQAGDISKLEVLLDAGADRNDVGRRGKTPMAYAIENNRLNMLRWLIDQRFDIEATDEFKNTALMVAASYGRTEAVKLLVEAGADIFRSNHIPYRAIEEATNLEIVRILVSHGEDLNDICDEMRAEYTGVGLGTIPSVSTEQYHENKHRRFGMSNPEVMNILFWDMMVKTGWSAFEARDEFGDDHDMPAVWSFRRFGKSITPLDDGRIVEIAGEHEDSYDDDFCIYNEVFVHNGRGGCQILGYPRDAFPPTDFHTATLAGDNILIVGNLGYWEDRRPGYTQVFKLDLKDFSITRVETSGDNPGWISRHKARLVGKTIHVTGGKIDTGDDYVDQPGAFSLSLDNWRWSELTNQN